MRGRPVLRKGSGVDDPPVRRRCEPRAFKCGYVFVGSQQVHRDIDMLSPGMAVNILFVVPDEEERFAAWLENAVNFGKGGAQLGVIVDRFDAEHRIKETGG